MYSAHSCPDYAPCCARSGCPLPDNCLQMFLRSTRCSLPPHTKEWLDDHTQPHDVAQFLTAKLQSVSPCSDAFATLQQAPGFIGAHFLDLTEPGEVWLAGWAWIEELNAIRHAHGHPKPLQSELAC
jgi:hypothetical protein